MSLAALALALAVLVAPQRPRSRLPQPASVSRSTRRALVPLLLLLGLTVGAGLLPIGAVVAATVVAGTFLVRRRRSLRSRQRAAEIGALNAALEIVAGELRAGAHPVTAIEAAADEVDRSVAVPLRAVAARARLGADVSAGLTVAAVGSASPPSWERLAVVWRLAESHGLTMAVLMTAAHRDVAERQRFSARVTAAMAGARATAAVLAGLPLLGLGLGQLIGAEPLRLLLSPGVGGWLLAVGVTLACCGLLWSDRIVDGVSS